MHSATIQWGLAFGAETQPMSGQWLAAGPMVHAWGQSVFRLGSYQRCTIFVYFYSSIIALN
jgi:hypothetical protein